MLTTEIFGKPSILMVSTEIKFHLFTQIHFNVKNEIWQPSLIFCKDFWEIKKWNDIGRFKSSCSKISKNNVIFGMPVSLWEPFYFWKTDFLKKFLDIWRFFKALRSWPCIFVWLMQVFGQRLHSSEDVIPCICSMNCGRFSQKHARCNQSFTMLSYYFPNIFWNFHCVKSVRIRSNSGPYSVCGKIQTRKSISKWLFKLCDNDFEEIWNEYN